MARAKMWWGRSQWWWSTGGFKPTWASNWLIIRGSITGPGAGTGLYTLDQGTEQIDLLAQFSLTPDRMPSSGNLFVSQPWLGLQGRLKADTSIGAIFDKPDIDCELIIEQTAYFGGNKVAHNKKSGWLLSVPEKANKTVTRDFGSGSRGLHFPNISFRLQRNKTLNIDLRVKIRTMLEGFASLDFLHSKGDPTALFGMKTPQWNIKSV